MGFFSFDVWGVLVPSVDLAVSANLTPAWSRSFISCRIYLALKMPTFFFLFILDWMPKQEHRYGIGGLD